ncbi:ABC transporter substrate-binding protein [Roseibium aggregatum]|nr:ABC transporter substrate-binding protein [Roseibium aggregatum]
MKNHLLAALMACASAAFVANTAHAADIKVGLLLPKSGPYAALGKEIEDGFNMALEEGGKSEDFKLVTEDSEAKPQVGVAKARKLVLQDEVDAMVGIVSSAVLGAVRDFVDGSKVPLVVANAGNDEATGKNCSRYITRVSFSNAQINRPMGEWMARIGVKKVYTLAPDYAAGHQMIDAFAESFKAAGGEIVGSEYTPFGKTQDFGPYLTKAKAASPDAIYVFYAGKEAITFVKQYDSFGLKKDIPLYGSGFLTSPLYVAAEGPAAIGVTTALHYVPTINTPENKAFVAAFKAKFDRAPSEFAVQGYDAGRVLVEAVKAGATDRASITEQLSKVSYSGPRGPLTIDPATNNVIQNIYVYETVADGDGLTQKMIGTIGLVRDPANGCTLK